MTAIVSAETNPTKVIIKAGGAKGLTGDDGANGTGLNDIRYSLLNNPLCHLFKTNKLATVSAPSNIDADIAWGRATPATYIDRYGFLKTAGVDVPREELDGFLFEGESTNVALYSEQIDNPVWVKSNATISANNLVSPDGSLSADTFIRTAAGFSSAEQIGLPFGSGVAVTISCWFIGDGVQSFKFGGFDIGGVTTDQTVTITPTQEWKRYTHSWVTVAGTTSVNMQLIRDELGDTFSISLWGAQAEDYISSYIATEGTAASRAKDIVTCQPYNNESNLQDELSIFMRVKAPSYRSGLRTLIAWGVLNSGDFFAAIESMSQIVLSRNNDGSNNNDVRSNYSTDDTFTYGYTITSAVTKSYLNGVVVDSTPTTASTKNNMLGSFYIGNNNGSNQLCGHIKDLRVYSSSLSNDELNYLDGA